MFEFPHSQFLHTTGSDRSAPKTDSIWKAVGKQLQHPRGVLGMLIGALMAQVNNRPNQTAIAALELTPSDHVLELGFGPGRSLRTMAKLAGHICGIDHSSSMLDYAIRTNLDDILQGKIELVSGQFDFLPWAGETFDKVLLVNVVYFFDLEGRNIAEVFRVMRPGGRVAIYVTDRSTMEKWPFARPDTHRIFGSNELRALLAQGGFASSAVTLRDVALSFGGRGLIAMATKEGRST